MRLIDEGCIDSLPLEKLESFISIYPKEEEVKRFSSKLQEAGFHSFVQGVQALQDKTLTCDDTTAFMMILLAKGSGLLEKAQVMIKFREIQSKLTNLMTRVNCWNFVTE